MSGTLRHTTMGRADAAWFAATVLACALMALLPLALDGGFYYFDDTAGGAFGQWWELGQQLRRGRWPILSLDSGYAGNYLVEGHVPAAESFRFLSMLSRYAGLVEKFSMDVEGKRRRGN